MSGTRVNGTDPPFSFCLDSGPLRALTVFTKVGGKSGGWGIGMIGGTNGGIYGGIFGGMYGGLVGIEPFALQAILSLSLATTLQMSPACRV